MRYFWFAYGQFAFYCAAKLLRYWSLVREDAGKDNFIDKLLTAFYILCLFASFPFSVLGWLADEPARLREFQRTQQLCRFVRCASRAKELPSDKQQAYATGGHDPNWNIDTWIEDELLNYGLYPDEAGFSDYSTYE